MLMRCTTKLEACMWRNFTAALIVSSVCHVSARSCVMWCKYISRPLTLSGMRSRWRWLLMGMLASLQNKSEASRWCQDKVISIFWEHLSDCILLDSIYFVNSIDKGRGGKNERERSNFKILSEDPRFVFFVFCFVHSHIEFAISCWTEWLIINEIIHNRTKNKTEGKREGGRETGGREEEGEREREIK